MKWVIFFSLELPLSMNTCKGAACLACNTLGAIHLTQALKSPPFFSELLNSGVLSYYMYPCLMKKSVFLKYSKIVLYFQPYQGTWSGSS